MNALQDQKIIVLSKHCWRLAEYLSDPTVFNSHHYGKRRDGDGVYWSDVGQYLAFAASITRVEVNTALYDDSAWVCRGASNLETMRCNNWSVLASELTVFNSIWNALENAVVLIQPKKVFGSIIDAACCYLKDPGLVGIEVPLYRETLTCLHDDLANYPSYKNIEKDFSQVQAIGLLGIGLHVIRKLRNRFAYGMTLLPMFCEKESSDSKIVETSSRLLLFTIQHLALVFFGRKKIPVAMDEDDLLLNAEAVNLLRCLHLNPAAPLVEQ